MKFDKKKAISTSCKSGDSITLCYRLNVTVNVIVLNLSMFIIVGENLVPKSEDKVEKARESN